ncbi:MAG: tail fiber domain-containing protein [Phaeodactylibacter sp.]|uniref:tail fiber domain-containing protein n=1 Tax=Phaeodactylibacter sp. TaxID=1940289 RepID=UPI0032EEEF0C
MKKITITLFALLFTFCLMAQAPLKISYQAVVRDANGQLITNSTVGMRISILKDSPTGPVQYAETHTSTTNANGLATLEIGEGTPVSGGTFFSIEWRSGSHYIQTETDPNGGTNYTISGTSQLLSVPYALYSNIAGVSTAWTRVGDNVASVPSGNVGIGTGAFIPESKLQVEADDAIRIYGTQGSFNHGGTIHFGDGNIVYLEEYEDDNLKLKANKTWVDSDVWVGPDPFQLNTGVDASKFEVKGEQVAIRGQVSVISANTNWNRGVVGSVQGGTGTNWGVYGAASNGINSVGVYGFGSTTVGATGVHGFGQGDFSRGVYGEANGALALAGAFNGDVNYTGELMGPSDAKLKKEVMALDGALEKVLQLEPKTYFFKTDEFTDLNLPTGAQMGFIAQEVQDIFPGVVHETAHVAHPKPGEETELRTTEYISINYLSFIPVLTKAIQEQQEEIESLKKENETLQARLERLEALVEGLQK